MIHLENENFDELIKDKVVVDFFATWCGPCKMLGPVFEELSTEINDIKFIKVDIDEHEDLCRKYKVIICNIFGWIIQICKCKYGKLATNGL